MASEFKHAPRILKSDHLQVNIHWHRDRFAHTVGVVREGRLVPILASMEGSGDQSWPPSPPLQSLDIQSQGDRETALLLGMAGSGHWSVAVELDTRNERLSVDIACRIKNLQVEQSGPDMRSSYRTMLQPVRASDNQARIGEILVSSNRQQNDEYQNSSIQVLEDGIEIVPCIVATRSPITLRWWYEMTISER